MNTPVHPPGEQWTALRAARLFDGVSGRCLRRPLVVVEDGVIVAVDEDGAPPAGVPVVDLGDCTLLPGLVDAHVHLVLPGVPDPVAAAAAPEATLLANARRAAAACLDAGVTTVRDLGDRGYVTLRLREEFELRPHSGPQLLVSGPPITTERGHCWFLGGAPETGSAPAEAVRIRAARGTDLVKIMASGGEITPGSHSWQAQFTAAELRSVVVESHRLGLPVAAHAHAVDAIEHALSAGVDTIEHGTFRTPNGVEPDRRLIERVAAAGVPVTVTTGFSPAGPPLDEPARVRIERTLAAALDMRNAGVRIICASDAGISDQKQHGLLPHGIIRLVEAGFPPVEALRAATSNAAEACGVTRKGRVAPGYEADFLAVRGDPFHDITALLSVAAVYRGGRRVR